MAYHPHTGFHYSKILPVCVMIMLALAIYQAWVLVGMGTGNCLTRSQIIHMVRLFEF